MSILTSSPYLSALPFAILLAVAAAALAAFFIVRSYSMKHKPVDYPLSEFTKLNLTEKSDLFAGKSVTSRVIQTDRERK